MGKVKELEQSIRDIFNIPRRHKNTRADWAAFNQACSALDAIGDTELAIGEFSKNNASFSLGVTYILVYGVLQALFLQQDAIKHLASSLGLPFNPPDELKKIRDLRNDAIGHPTSRDLDKRKGIRSFHHISRATLSREGFKMMSTYSDKETIDFKDVSLNSIIEIQSRFSEKLLLDIFMWLRDDENTHRGKFMNNKLTEIFHPSISYLFSTVAQGIRNREPIELALSAFESISKMISTFEMKLKERSEEETIGDIMKDLEYPIDKVMRYLKGDKGVDAQAAAISCEYIDGQVDSLKQIAKEIEDLYRERLK